MNKTLTVLFAAVGATVLMGLILLLGSAWAGYALSVIWGWFIVPIFHLPALSVAQAIGISIVMAYLTHPVTMPETKENEDTTTKVLTAIAITVGRPAFVLFFAWIVKFFL